MSCEPDLDCKLLAAAASGSLSLVGDCPGSMSTAIPGKHELLHWAENYVSTWNTGDKDAWAANWRKVLRGEIRMLDPVGTPEKVGFEQACLHAYDMYRVPTHQDKTLGDIFKQYQPEHQQGL